MAKPGNPVGWFEIPVTDLARAQAFYEKVFGVALSVNQMGPVRMAWFPMGNDAYGASGSLVQGPGHTPGQTGTLIYFTAFDLQGILGRIAAGGGKVLEGVTSIGDYGTMAVFEDSEGNRVALHRPPDAMIK